MTYSNEAVEIIKHFEGFEAAAYRCPAGKWTIGYGHTLSVSPSMRISKDEGERLLRQDLQYLAPLVAKELRTVTQSQFDALVSFAFNVGLTKFKQSTLLKKLNAGDLSGAADEFPKWRKGGGKVLPGLVRRREAEKRLFEGKEWRA